MSNTGSVITIINDGGIFGVTPTKFAVSDSYTTFRMYDKSNTSTYIYQNVFTVTSKVFNGVTVNLLAVGYFAMNDQYAAKSFLYQSTSTGGARTPGVVEVYTVNTGSLVTSITTTATFGGVGGSGGFGGVLAMSDTKLLIGHQDQSKVYVYNINDWSLAYTIDQAVGNACITKDYLVLDSIAVYDPNSGTLLYNISDEPLAGGGQARGSIKIRNNIAIIGDPNESGNIGAAYLYDLEKRSSLLISYNPTPGNEGGVYPYDGYGQSVAINKSGIAIGAPYDDGPGSAPSNDSAGILYLRRIIQGSKA
jgi:hypothetical protein